MQFDDSDSNDPLCDLWQAALDSDIGIGIITDDRGLLRQHLYRARALANNPKFEDISMILPEKEDEIWLVRKHANGSRAPVKGDFKPIRQRR
jgi:hypothetical protein